jgi:hypothetical protein
MLIEESKQEFESAQSDDEKSKLVYTYFGLAAYWVQCLEQTFENMIIIATFINKESIDIEFVDSFYEQLEKSKDTMGSLLRKVKGVYSISDEHIEALSEIIETRNYLIHRYFKTNSLKRYTNEGKLEMILELVGFVQKTIEIDEVLKKYYFGYLNSFGITEDMLKAVLESKKKEEINKRRNGG